MSLLGAGTATVNNIQFANEQKNGKMNFAKMGSSIIGNGLNKGNDQKRNNFISNYNSDSKKVNMLMAEGNGPIKATPMKGSEAKQPVSEHKEKIVRNLQAPHEFDKKHGVNNFYPKSNNGTSISQSGTINESSPKHESESKLPGSDSMNHNSRSLHQISQYLSQALVTSTNMGQPETTGAMIQNPRLLKPDSNLVRKLLQEEKDERYRYLLRHGSLHHIEAETFSIYVELPQIRNILIIYRRPVERESNPEKLTLDSRGLKHIPLLEGEEKVKYLNLQNNQIASIQNLVSLPNLHFLDLSSNQLRQINHFPAVDHLRVLILSKNLITSISNLDAFKHLDVLDLHENQISGKLDFNQCLHTLQSLRILNLSNNRIEEVEIQCQMKSLVELNLRQNKIKSLVINST